MIIRAAVLVSSNSSFICNKWNPNPPSPYPACASSSFSNLRRSLATPFLRSSHSQSSCKDRRRRNRNVAEFESSPTDEFIVVNFYLFVMIQDPEAEVARHLHFVKELDLHGRVYLNEQGINAQYSGPSKDALAYVNWLREDPKFSNILVQFSPSRNGHAFPKLKLRYKPSLVQLEGGVSHLPLLDPSMRATPLSPSEWRRKLEAVKEKSDKSANQNVVLLDVMNGTLVTFLGLKDLKSTALGVRHLGCLRQRKDSQILWRWLTKRTLRFSCIALVVSAVMCILLF